MFQDDGRFEARASGPPPRVSGEFEVFAERTTELWARILRTGTVTGRLDSRAGGAVESAVVRLRHRKRYSNPLRDRSAPGWQAPDAETFLQESALQVVEDGVFQFEGVLPGEKQILARWEGEGQRFSFAPLAFALEPGESKDLGVLQVSGHSVEALVRFESPDGEPLEAETLFGSAGAGVELVVLSAAEVAVEHNVTDRLRVRLDEPFSLHGLQAGTYVLDVLADREAWSRALPPYAVLQDRSKEMSLRLPGEESLIVPLAAARVCRLEVVAELPGAALETVPIAGLIDLASGELHEVRLHESASGLHAGVLPLVPGSYRLVARALGADRQSFGADELVAVPSAPESRATVRLVPAVTVLGELYRLGGEAAAGEVLAFAPQTALAGDDGPWLQRPWTDGRGRFTLAGLLPGTTWIGAGLRTPIAVPARPGVVELSFTLGP